MPIQHFVVDGSNIATEGRSTPSLVQLEEAVEELRREYPEAEVTVVVDATFAHRIDPAELERFEREALDGHYVYPPAGAIGRGDAFLLRIAERVKATVLSNDSFQEFHGEHGWLFEPARLLGATPVPGVGWIFIARTPVRGPRSRVAMRDASRAKAQVSRAIAEATKEVVEPSDGEGRPGGGRRGTRPTSASPQAVNDPFTFISFIAEHRLGDLVEAEVEGFTSHGAIARFGEVRCYVPLSGLASPPPRSAREVLRRYEARSFAITALDPYRRGVELALPEVAVVSGRPSDETVEAEVRMARHDSRRQTAPVAGALAGAPAPADEPAVSAKAAVEPSPRKRIGATARKAKAVADVPAPARHAVAPAAVTPAPARHAVTKGRRSGSATEGSVAVVGSVKERVPAQRVAGRLTTLLKRAGGAAPGSGLLPGALDGPALPAKPAVEARTPSGIGVTTRQATASGGAPAGQAATGQAATGQAATGQAATGQAATVRKRASRVVAGGASSELGPEPEAPKARRSGSAAKRSVVGVEGEEAPRPAKRAAPRGSTPEKRAAPRGSTPAKRVVVPPSEVPLAGALGSTGPRKPAAKKVAAKRSTSSSSAAPNTPDAQALPPAAPGEAGEPAEARRAPTGLPRRRAVPGSATPRGS